MQQGAGKPAPIGTSPVRRYIAKRLLMLVPVLLGASLVIFALIRLIPGDAALVMLGARARPDSIQQFNQRYGLDQPLPVQYLLWLSNVVQGDLGDSLRTHQPVLKELLARLPHTIELSFFSILIGALAGLVLGVLAAIHRNQPLDYLTTITALIGLCIPVFWLALMLILLFSVGLGWLPAGGRLAYQLRVQSLSGFPLLDSLLTGNCAAFVDLLKHILMPAFVLATPTIAITASMTRSSMLEVMGQDYIRTARAKGLKEQLVISRHALRNALMPVITTLGLDVGWLLGGAVVTESIFAWPGVGRFVFESIKDRDYPAIQASVLFIVTVFVTVNLLVDLLYAYVNPRIRYE